MTIYDRPDEKVLAEGAHAGEVLDFPDILRGWGIAFDQTGGLPPVEWVNGLARRADRAIRYFMQRGLPEWSASEDYPSGAYVQYNGNSYLSKRANANKLPSANVNDWGLWSISRDEFTSATLRLGSVVGAARGVRAVVAAASTSITFAAAEVVVETALGGQSYRVANLNQVLNLATVGTGGMDVGVAPTSGFVAIYAIYNVATGATALLATNATASVAPEVYGGANMPAGYTASALLSVWATNASRQLSVGLQLDRKINTQYKSVLNSSTQQPTLIALSIASAVPPNAKRCSGFTFMSITANGVNATTAVAASGSTASDGIGQVQMVGFSNINSNNYTQMPFSDMPILTGQTLFYAAYIASGTYGGLQLFISGYDF